MTRSSTSPDGRARALGAARTAMSRAARSAAVWVLALTLAATLLAGAGVGGCGEQETANPTSQLDAAKDTAVKAGILAIQTGIQAYIASTQTAPPGATKDVLGGFVQPWPQNPWTKTDMTEGEDPGDFTYTAGSGTSYKLVGHLSDGREFVKP